MSAASAASIASYPSSGSGNASAATSVVVTSGMASSPKSPIIAEVSPAYRRWSEATASIDTSASSGKKNNEWSSNFERSYMEMEGKWNYIRHGLRTPNEDINSRNLKFRADVAVEICFGRTYEFGIGIWFSALQWRRFLHPVSVVRDIRYYIFRYLVHTLFLRIVSILE